MKHAKDNNHENHPRKCNRDVAENKIKIILILKYK